MMKLDEQAKAAVEKAKSILAPICEKMGCEMSDLLEDEPMEVEEMEFEPEEGDDSLKLKMIAARMKAKKGGYEEE